MGEASFRCVADPPTALNFARYARAVERIAVRAVRPRQESVVRGVVHCAREHAVDHEHASSLVQLVLDLRALRDLDDDPEVLLDSLPRSMSCHPCIGSTPW